MSEGGTAVAAGVVSAGAAGASMIQAVGAYDPSSKEAIDLIGDLRTDALHEALSRAPIEDDTLLGDEPGPVRGWPMKRTPDLYEAVNPFGRTAARMLKSKLTTG